MANSRQAAARVNTQPLPSEQDDFDEIMSGLRAEQKTINPKYFYDQLGSQLFEEITNLPEYYPTRTEINILKDNAGDIANLLGDNVYLVEPGAGSCEKVRYLLDAVRPKCYLPMDISNEFLQDAVNQLISDFAWLHVHPIAADFNQDILLPHFPPDSKTVVFYPGSTIGNFNPTAAVEFLTRIAQWISPNGGLLLGADLQKDEATLHAAYNDSQQITQKFNLNILDNINSILGSNFDSNNFSHHAFYNHQEQRIEMHLVANTNQQVNCGGEIINLDTGESIHTENSYKFTLTGIANMAAQAGLSLQYSWCDDNNLFSMNYLVAAD